MPCRPNRAWRGAASLHATARLPRFTGSANWPALGFAPGLAAARGLETRSLDSVADFLVSPRATF